KVLQVLDGKIAKPELRAVCEALRAALLPQVEGYGHPPIQPLWRDIVAHHTFLPLDTALGLGNCFLGHYWPF
ncbi:MAG: hypothetical protein AAFQ08_01115, partial [Bacteroidota bacterium]